MSAAPVEVIAVHPASAALVDWPRLAIPGQSWSLLTTAASAAELRARGRDRGLRRVVELPAFSDEALAAAAVALLPPGARRDAARLVTMIEPMQLPLARLRERLGVPGPGPAILEPFIDKIAMKRAMRGAARHLPRWIAHDPAAFAADPAAFAARVIEAVGLPAFGKPAAEYSAIGARRLDRQEDVLAYLAAARGAVEIEEYVAGEVLHLDSVVIGGQERWFGAGRYLAPPVEALSGRPLGGVVLDATDPLRRELQLLHRALLAALPQVPDGCTHMEVIRRGDGSSCFLEVAARAPGWRIPEIHEIHQGIDLRLVHYQVQAGQAPDLSVRPGPQAAFYCPLKTDPGPIARLRPPLLRSPHRLEWYPAWRGRTDVVSSLTMADFLGAVVLWNEDPRALAADLAALLDHRPYDIGAP